MTKESELVLFCYENEDEKSLKAALSKTPAPKSIAVGRERRFDSVDSLYEKREPFPIAVGKIGVGTVKRG